MATLNPQQLATALQDANPFVGSGNAANVVMGHLDTVLGSNNALLRNARTSGLEQAASRGLQNSSIASGAAQRASLDYALPLVGHAQDTFNQREHRGWQTGERLGSQNWQSGERALDRTHDFSMQDHRQTWQSGENQMDRDWRTGERIGQQEWQSGESALDRDWRTGERIGQQEWQSGESALDRDWRSGESALDREWQSGESAIDRDWRTGERIGQQDWQSSEALRDRDWRSLEAGLDREFTTEEREAVQAWQSGEAELSRDQQVLMANIQEEMNRAQRGWTAEQNQLDRDQQLTMAEVQNWLNNETFMRDFNAQLATMPINNTANLLNFISQQAITNPEIYTPDVVSGMSEFFTSNSMDVLSRYFPNYFNTSGGA